MLVKMTLLDTVNLSNISKLNESIVGFMNDVPERGHSLFVWHELDGDSAYTRTTRVNDLIEYKDDNTGLRYWRAETQNSTYRIAEINEKQLEII